MNDNSRPLRTCLLPDYRNSPFEGYSIKYLERNHWRFKKVVGDWDDAVSEAALCFYDCRKRYGGKVKTPQHFMALYKRCLYSWFTDWSNWDSRVNSTEKAYSELKQQTTTEQEGFLSCLLREGSKELQDVLKLIVNAPAEVVATLKSDLRGGLDGFFTNATAFCNIPREKAPILERELRNLLK